MSTLEQHIVSLAQSIGADIKGLNNLVGVLSGLNTSAKSNIVAAINEVQGIASTNTTNIGTLTGLSAKTYLNDQPSGVKLGYGKALTGLTGSLVLYKPCGHLNTITAGLGQIDRETKGAIIIPPGGLLALLAPAIGTTHVVHAAIDITKVEVTA